MLLCDIPFYLAAKNSRKPIIDDLVDIKDFKKLLRTKNNVLVCFISSAKQNANIIKVFEESADAVKGQGTMVLIDCSTEAKKLCKKFKVSPDPYVLKHYKDGEFHKNYDRKETVSSMLNFMRDPTGDVPWAEDPSTSGIVHIQDAVALSKLLRKETGPVMVMFYAPWCGFCKQLKPDYSAAALELKGHSILAAIDVNRPENAIIRTKFNITGFPTLIYFENGIRRFNYEGDNNKQSIIDFMKNPTAAPVKPVETEWSAMENDVKHLTDANFDDAIAESDSILIMFYAPWCGHCKKMKPEYEKAAERIKRENIPGVLAALDATKEPKSAKKFSITGYPTVKYFKNGEFQFDITLREEDKIIEFMKNPKEPPPPPPPEKPWSEEQSEVVHLTTETFKPFLKKKKFVLVMFYAPWCGHCKKAKPEFTAAADVFKDESKIEFAAIDCTTHSSVCNVYEVKGYPTIKLFQYLNKEPVQDYSGGRTKEDFVKFMAGLSGQKIEMKPVAEKENKDENKKQFEVWGSPEGSRLIIRLSEKDFDSEIRKHDSLLIFFYKLPGCNECQRLKEKLSKVALELKNADVAGRVAAFDATDSNKIQKEVIDFPALRYYKKGKYVTDVSPKSSTEELFNLLRKPPGVNEHANKDEL